MDLDSIIPDSPTADQQRMLGIARSAVVQFLFARFLSLDFLQ